MAAISGVLAVSLLLHRSLLVGVILLNEAKCKVSQHCEKRGLAGHNAYMQSLFEHQYEIHSRSSRGKRTWYNVAFISKLSQRYKVSKFHSIQAWVQNCTGHTHLGPRRG